MKNQLVITIDGIRKDRVPCYNSEAAYIMPNIARIAPKCFIFDNMIAAATSTVMCFSTIFTGRYNREFRRKTYGESFNPFPDNVFSDFESRGYETFVCLNKRFEPHANFINAYSKAQFLWTGRKVTDRSTSEKDASSLHPEEQAAYLYNFLKSRQTPWFTWIHIWGFSSPFDKFLVDIGNGFEYDGRIREMDAAIGFLFDKFKESSDIFIFADHGYAFFEKNKWAYGKTGSNLVNPVMEVPFLFYNGVKQGRNKNMVSQIHVRNIINKPDEAASFKDDICFCESRYINQKDKALAIRKGPYKLNYYYQNKVSEFYDLSTDPSETIDYLSTEFYKLYRDEAGNTPPKKPFVVRKDWADLFNVYRELLDAANNYYFRREPIQVNVEQEAGEVFVKVSHPINDFTEIVNSVREKGSKISALFEKHLLSRHVINEGILKTLYRIRKYYCYPALDVFVQHGLEPLRIEKVPTDKIHVIRPVTCNETKSEKIELMPWYEEYFGENWSIRKSMLLKFLQDAYLKNFSDHKDRKDLSSHDYFKMHTYMRQFGSHPRSDEWIEARMRSFIKLTENIERNGYDYSRLSNYIIVVEEPMCQTRYGIDHSIDGYEIYTGHHRAAAVCYLNIKDLWVIIAKDIARHTPHGVKIGMQTADKT